MFPVGKKRSEGIVEKDKLVSNKVERELFERFNVERFSGD